MTGLLEKLTFKARLFALVALFVAAIGSVSILSLRNGILNERESGTQSVMDIASGIVSYYHELALSGKVDEQTARKAAMAQLREVRYGKGASFLVVDTGGTMLLDPGFVEMEGRNRMGSDRR